MVNKIAIEVERILSAELGEFIAQATMKKNLEQMGTSPDKLTGAQLGELAERLEKAVNYFGGNGKGEMVALKIRALKG